jgi:hypothetical protein
MEQHKAMTKGINKLMGAVRHPPLAIPPSKEIDFPFTLRIPWARDTVRKRKGQELDFLKARFTSVRLSSYCVQDFSRFPILLGSASG